jgi:hypothetical protein
MRQQRRLEQKRDQRYQHELGGDEQRDDAEQLADVDGRTIRRRHQQRAQRFRLTFALEGPTECERASEGDCDPEDARSTIFRRFSFFHQCEREKEHARDGEEQRRIRNLQAPHLDRQVLLEDQPGGSNHGLRLMMDR